MTRDTPNITRALASALGLAIALSAISLPLLSPGPARADSPQTQLDQKAQWQDRYRSLLRNAARLQGEIERSSENYARAQRRNYPRGGARQQFILDADEAEKELITVKAEIEEIFVDARREAVPSHWLYDVDDEPISLDPPASASEDDGEDRAGRNPLYFQD